jgi:type I restriction enzyme M protein
MTYLEQALEKGYLQLTGDGKNQKIVYVAADYTGRYSDPEEQVRAEFWAELVLRYEYKPERIHLEVTVPRRTPTDRADIVVCKDDENKDPYIVVECKKDGISDAEFNQAVEQACGNRASLGAPFAAIVAGSTRRFLDFSKHKPQEREKNIVADLPVRYGNPPENRYYKGKAGQDLSSVSREMLRSAIRKCHQTLWEGGKRTPIAAFGEFCKIIFIKIRDEKETKQGKPYQVQQRTGETLEELSQRIQNLYEAEQKAEPGVFTEKINVEPGVLAQVVEHIEAINFNKTDLDTKGVAFEEFMGSFFKGDFGQYFTPRELIAFCVQMLSPEKSDLVLDPACGSGGFLLYALDYIREQATREYSNWETDAEERQNWLNYWHPFAQNNIFGIEINDELARVAKMNMIIHDDGHTNIISHDALDFTKELKAERAKIKPGNFDLILTNPPFGSVVKEAEKGKDYMAQFELRNYLNKATTGRIITEEGESEGVERGAKAVKLRASVKTEILFLERVHTFLKPNTGRAAVVVPDGILTNSSLQGVRDWLLEHFQILAVVGLPQFAFQHYDAGVKASILFMRRLEKGETITDETPIFMALAENIGYDATGRKTFEVKVESETPAKEKVEIHHCDFFDYRVWYNYGETADKGKPGWSERHRAVIPNTGLVAQFYQFQRDPTPFFV